MRCVGTERGPAKCYLKTRRPPGAALAVPRRGTNRKKWPVSRGAPIEKNGRFRWAVWGCWGLQTGYEVGKTPLEITRA
jgi:hypothetical protein